MVTCPGPSGNRNRRHRLTRRRAGDRTWPPSSPRSGHRFPLVTRGRLVWPFRAQLPVRAAVPPEGAFSAQTPPARPCSRTSATFPASADDPQRDRTTRHRHYLRSVTALLDTYRRGMSPRGVEVVSPRLRRRRDRRHAELHERPDRGEDHIAWLQEPREVGRRGDIHLGRGRSASKRSARASILVRFRPTKVGSSPRASSSRSTRCPVYPVASSNMILRLSTTPPWCG